MRNKDQITVSAAVIFLWNISSLLYKVWFSQFLNVDGHFKKERDVI